MNGVLFEEARPVAEVSPNRADIACFIGFVNRRATALPESVNTWLQENGWRPADAPVADADELLHTPLPLENFESFDLLFQWEDRGGAGWTTWLGAAVRSFFAQGGARCYVVRAGDAWQPTSESLVLAADDQKSGIGKLIPGSVPNLSPDCTTWQGLDVLQGLEDVAFVCLPDLPELVADAALAAGKFDLPLPPPEEFREYSTIIAPAKNANRPQFRSPACTAAGYSAWFSTVNNAVAFLKQIRRDVQLILAVPLPAEGKPSQGDLLGALSHKDGSGLQTPLANGSSPAGIATAFLQLVYPWLATDNAESLPGGWEPPDGAFVGIASRTVAKLGAHRSLGRQPLQRVSRFYPLLTARDQQLLTPNGAAPALIHRVSLLGQTPDGPRVLSDVTTSLSPAHRPAAVGRLTAAILRTARRLGEEVTFDASGPALWRKLERRLESLLTQFFRAGALLGDTAAAAFSVRCDETTTTQNDLDNGRVIAVVSFAPAQPVGLITVVLSLREGALLAAEAPN